MREIYIYKIKQKHKNFFLRKKKKKRKEKFFLVEKIIKMCKYAQRYFLLARCSMRESMSISAENMFCRMIESVYTYFIFSTIRNYRLSLNINIFYK